MTGVQTCALPISINNLPIGRNVDETLRILKAIQYTDENPDEVCPANWQPGEPVIPENWEKSREYFSNAKVNKD